MKLFRRTDLQRTRALRRRFDRIKRSYLRNSGLLFRFRNLDWVQVTVMDGLWAKSVRRRFCSVAMRIGIRMTKWYYDRLYRLEDTGLNPEALLGTELENLRETIYDDNRRYLNSWVNLNYGSGIPKPVTHIW